MSGDNLLSKKRFGVLLVSLLLIVFGLSDARFARLNAQNEKSLYVGRIQGGLGVQRAALNSWREMVSGDQIGNGQLLRVSQAGSADLQFGDSTLVLGARTRLTTKATPTGLFAILQEGSVRAQVSAADGPLELTLSLGRVRVLDGETLITSGPAGTTLRLIRGRCTAFYKTETKGVELIANEDVLWTGKSQSVAPREKTGTITKIPDEPETEEPSVGKLVMCDTLGRQTEPLQIRELRVKIQINGATALTEIEQTFFNPTATTAEGVFYFPLPADAAICRLAMYVDGRLMEGELVERLRAREVYEEIVRGRRDPALMEWQEGNVFKTRIFPIPANGPKRILVSYTQALPSVDGRRGYVYPLVSKTTQTTFMGRFELNMTVRGLAADEPFFVPSYPDAVVKRGPAGVTVSLERKQFHPKRDFVARWVPENNNAVEIFCRRNGDEDGHFMLSCQTKPGMNQGEKKAAGRDFLLLVDTSLSRRPGDYRAQLAFAEAFLNELNADDRFAILPFDVKPRLPQNGFASTATARTAALAELKAIIPMGATNLEAAFEGVTDYLSQQPSREQLEVILLGDGIATMGETAVEKLAPKIAAILKFRKARVHAVLVGGEHDRTLAAEVAGRSGGLLRFLTPGDNVIGEAFRLALALDSTLVAVPEVVFAGTDVYDVYAKQSGTMIAGDELILFGRYKHKEKLNVTVKQADGSELKADFILPQVNRGNYFIPDFWARERLNVLMLKEQTPEVCSEIVTLSQKYSLISPYTSWLVLETEADYQRYGINRLARRRYWEVLGGMTTDAPPEEKVDKQRPIVMQPRPIEKPNEEMKQVAPPPQLLTLADVDLSLLRVKNGRDVSTALSSLCLQVYYRYLPLYNQPVNLGTIEPVAPLSVINFNVLDASSTGRQSSDKNEKWFKPDPQMQAANSRISPLPQTATRTDINASRGEEAVSDVPLGGKGTVASIGLGGGIGGAFGQRSYGGRRHFLRVGGGSPYTENSVYAAGNWLAKQQDPDGSWNAGGCEETGLALLTFLGAGHTEKVGRYKDCVSLGLKWLISQQKNDGQISEGLLNHCVATVTLAEAAGMGRIPETQKAAQKAVEWLETKQNMRDGKRKGFGKGLVPSGSAENIAPLLASAEDGDPFISTWATLALKSAKVSGLAVNVKVIDGLATYLSEIQGENGAVGLCGKPRGNEIHLLHTACVSVARLFLGNPTTDARLVKAVQLLDKLVVESKTMTDDGLYLRYFANLLMFQAGGNLWKRWNTWLKNELLDFRLEDGSWSAVGIWHRNRPVPSASRDFSEQIAEALISFLCCDASSNAYENTAAALSKISNVDLLRRMLNGPGRLPPTTAGLIRLRIGLILLQNQQYEDALVEIQAVYERNNRPENVFFIYANLLQKMNRHRELLEILMRDMVAGKNNRFRSAMVAELLFHPEVAVQDSVVYIEQRLNNQAGKYPDLLWLLAQAAQAKRNFKAAAYFFEKAYEEVGRPEQMWEPYVNSLVNNEQFNKAAKELEWAIQVGRHTPWVFENLAVCYGATHRSKHELLRACTNQLELYPKEEWAKTGLVQKLIAQDTPTALSYLIETGLFSAKYFHFVDQIARRSMAQNDDETLLKTLQAMFDIFQKTGTTWHGGVWGLADVLKKESIAKALEQNQDFKRWLSEYVREDLAVVMTWDTQNTDVELHVGKPNGKRSSSATPYNNDGDRWVINNDGGKISKTFLLYRANPGDYTLTIGYRQGTWPTNVSLKIFRNRGGLNETAEEVRLTLKKQNEQVLAKTVTMPAKRETGKNRAAAMDTSKNWRF